MNVTQDMSVWGLVAHASLFVQLVMLGLLLASLLSWWYFAMTRNPHSVIHQSRGCFGM